MKTSSVYMENQRSIALHPPLARAFGDRPALILQQIRYWMNTNKEAEMQRPANDRLHFRNGRWWVFNTYEEWQRANFDFWSKRTIERHIKDLEDKGVLIAESFNKMGGDMTRWYTIDFDALDSMVAQSESDRTPLRQNGVMGITTNCRDHYDKMAESIYKESESTTENTIKDSFASSDDAQSAPPGELSSDAAIPEPIDECRITTHMNTVPEEDGAHPFDVGAPAVWVKESRGGYGYVHYIPVKVVRYTERRVCVGWETKTGEPRTSYVTADKLYADETAARAAMSGLKRLAELPPLQQVIGKYSFGLKDTQGITAQLATRINLVVQELHGRFGTNGAAVSEQELRAAYGMRGQQPGAIIPTDPVKVGKMVSDYRATKPAARPTPTRPPDPHCTICGGIGVVKAPVEFGHPDFGKTHACRCTRQESEAHHE